MPHKLRDATHIKSMVAVHRFLKRQGQDGATLADVVKSLGGTVSVSQCSAYLTAMLKAGVVSRHKERVSVRFRVREPAAGRVPSRGLA